MQLINTTEMAVGYNGALDLAGRELLVVVIKGTFTLPHHNEPMRLHEKQQPLIVADEFSGPPGWSAPLREIDFAARKPACDVLMLGSAYAPLEKPVTRTQVSLRIGLVHKRCNVFGDRVWRAGMRGITASAPEPFTRMPLSYERAFGGVDHESDDPAQHDAYLPNPVGRGYRKHLRSSWVDGRSMPNLESVDQAVTVPDGCYAPTAFGPLGRAWPARAGFAGTYDAAWREHVMPFLPLDFDERYHQAAPFDQQMPFPTEPLEVSLQNLTPDGRRDFILPHYDAWVRIDPRRSEREVHRAVLDTIVLEPDDERITLTWRVTRPLRRSLFDIASVHVGHTRRERFRPVALSCAIAATA